MFGGEVYPSVVWQVHFEEDRAFFYMVLEHLSPGREFAPAGREFHLHWAWRELFSLYSLHLNDVGNVHQSRSGPGCL